MVVGDFPIKGRIAVVTGGGSGINLSFVRLALKNGARILIADLKLLPEAEELVNESKGNAAFVKCDVANWAELEKLPAEVSKAFNDVADIWIPGAGVFEPKWSSFLYDEETDFYRTLQINSAHPIKLTRIAMRSAMGAGKPCVVLHESSIAGLSGSYPAALYCASKHAIAGFVKAMAQADIDEDIKIIAICPGVVSTPLWTHRADNFSKQMGYSDEMGITPEEVAEAMLELIQDGKYEGGTLMQIDKEGKRLAESAQAVPLKGEGLDEWKASAYAPIREVYKKEREVGKKAGAPLNTADADVYDAILTTPVHDLRRAIVKACEANEQYRELTTKHLLIPADPNDSSTRKRKAFERCVHCRGTFEVLKSEDGDCVYHHGLKQVGFHNDFWADHDPDAHGEPETFKDDPDFQDGFVWSCCKGAGDAEGCVVTRHVAAAADDDDDRENKARKTSESEASADEDEEEDHR